MRASWSPEDTEKLLRGHRPRSADAARLESAIAALRSRAHGTVEPSAVAAMASLLAEAAVTPVAAVRERPSRRAVAQPASPWRRRVAVAGLVATLGTAGVAGAAAAADGSAPGDTLYSFDRALEAIGIDNGGAGERLAEAGKLAGNGDVEGALRHAADALQGAGDSSSSEALLAAADRIVSTEGGASADAKGQVAQMLRWMATADVKGKDFGQTVSTYARTVGGSDEGAADDTASPATSGDTATTGGQGNSGSHGKPETPGNSGKSGDAGKPSSGNKSFVTPSGASEDHPGKRSGG